MARPPHLSLRGPATAPVAGAPTSSSIARGRAATVASGASPRPFAGKAALRRRWRRRSGQSEAAAGRLPAAAAGAALVTALGRCRAARPRLWRLATAKDQAPKAPRPGDAVPSAEDAGKGLAGRLWQEFRQQAKPLLLVPATLISMSLSATGALRAFCSGRLLDIAVRQPAAGFSDFAGVAAIYFAAALYGYVANVVEGILFALARWDMSMAMRQKLFKALLRQEVSYFEANPSGALVSRLTNDTDQMQQVLNRSPETLVTNVMRVVIALVLMSQQHLQLTLVSVLPLPFAWMLIKRTGRIVSRYSVLQNDALAHVNAVASEAIANVRAVQLARAEQTETQAYGRAIGGYLKVIRETLFSETALRFVSTLVNDAGTDVPLMCLCCWLISQGQLSVGQFYTYRTLLFSYRRGFRELAELFTGISRAKAVSQRYFDIIDRRPAVASAQDAVHLEPGEVRGHLQLHGVSFRYPGKEHLAVSDVDLEVEPGQIVALVGASGAGKSTLLRLCARLYDPEAGSVTLDGTDVRQVDLKDLRRCLGVVDQDPAMFDRTVEENIAYGLEADLAAGDGQEVDQRIRKAAEDARAAAFVEDLPGKFSEQLGERGARISGGQRQRLALARALARGTPVLLLDEPTSALDGETEEAVGATLAALAKDGRTVLVAAHRLGTVARADCIIVMERGRVVEAGTRDELKSKKNSRYSTVVEPGLAAPAGYT